MYKFWDLVVITSCTLFSLASLMNFLVCGMTHLYGFAFLLKGSSLRGHFLTPLLLFLKFNKLILGLGKGLAKLFNLFTCFLKLLFYQQTGTVQPLLYFIVALFQLIFELKILGL